MPNFLISHQAPALLIKLKYPRKINTTAICIGSMIPDLNLFSELLTRNFTHSFIGVIIVTIPITILLTIIFNKCIASLISRISSIKYAIFKPLRFFGLDDLKYMNKKFNKKSLLIVSYSALIGGLTHLLLDMPSHPFIEFFYPLVVLDTPRLFPNFHIDFGTITVFTFQYHFVFSLYYLIRRICDCILIPITLYLLRYIKKHDLVQKWRPNEVSFSEISN